VESVNVRVLPYPPVRSESVALTCWRNVIAAVAFETGVDQVAGAMSTRSGSDSANAPLVRGGDAMTGLAPGCDGVVCYA
jgi:hypothetical protein